MSIKSKYIRNLQNISFPVFSIPLNPSLLVNVLLEETFKLLNFF